MNWVGPATVLSSSLKASQCVGLGRKLISWSKCHPKHTATLHSSRSPHSVCLSYNTYVGKSDHVSRLSQLCQKALTDQIILCLHRLCISARHAMLHKHSFVVMWCQHWKIPFYAQQVVKRQQVCLDVPSTLLLCCGAVCLQEKRQRVQCSSLFRWKKLHLLHEMQEVSSTEAEGK